MVVALAVTQSRSEPAGEAVALPQAVLSPDGGWYESLAVRAGAVRDGQKTACGEVLTPETIGVGHPVLPCGAKIFVSFRDREVLTQVIKRGPSEPGAEFELTPALADKLRLDGVQRVRWAFARG